MMMASDLARDTGRRDLSDTLAALADPTRRAILQRLIRGQARVTALAEPFDISLNAVSKHIRILERARLVHRRRQGREHVLTFNPAPLDQAAAWIDSQRAIWSARLDALDALLSEEDAAAPPAPAPTRKRVRARRSHR
jgi:DNA-binding transcriptional ArsR family regulator